MSRYKVGDIVTVRHDLLTGRSYYMENGNTYNNVISEMLALCGEQVRIIRVASDGQYQVDKDLTGCYWTDGMFEDITPARFASELRINDEIIDDFIPSDLSKLYKEVIS